jgi:hypothetical protein
MVIASFELEAVEPLGWKDQSVADGPRLAIRTLCWLIRWLSSDRAFRRTIETGA